MLVARGPVAAPENALVRTPDASGERRGARRQREPSRRLLLLLLLLLAGPVGVGEQSPVAVARDGQQEAARRAERELRHTQLVELEPLHELKLVEHSQRGRVRVRRIAAPKSGTHAPEKDGRLRAL